MRRVLILALLLFTDGLASAQPIPRGEVPTPGLYNPALGVVSDADASAVDKNPALTGFLRSWSAVYLHTDFLHSDVATSGDGLWLASPLPYLSSLVVGTGLQWLRPPDNFPYSDFGKFNLSLAWRIVPALAIGFDY